jgi:hypothetical protein
MSVVATEFPEGEAAVVVELLEPVVVARVIWAS